jgi:nicotinamidase-related amidase
MNNRGHVLVDFKFIPRGRVPRLIRVVLGIIAGLLLLIACTPTPQTPSKAPTVPTPAPGPTREPTPPPSPRTFMNRGGPWPSHCVAGTSGAEFPSTLALPPETEVVSKGVSSEAGGYSGFESTALEARLRELGCKRVFIGGLATDYCVRATALDALTAGFDVVVLEDGVRSVEVRSGDGERALQELVSAGAQRTRMDNVSA